jgi:hypothetical protein
METSLTKICLPADRVEKTLKCGIKILGKGLNRGEAMSRFGQLDRLAAESGSSMDRELKYLEDRRRKRQIRTDEWIAANPSTPTTATVTPVRKEPES